MNTIKTPAYRPIVFIAMCALSIITSAVLLLELAYLFLTYKFLIGVAAGWMVLGFISYIVFFRFVPPAVPRKVTPLEDLEPEPAERPFPNRAIPFAVMTFIGMAIAGPFLLLPVALGLKHRIQTHRRWRQLFPNSTKTEIREFVEFLAHSLNNPLPENYRPSPDDPILPSYGAIYRPGTGPDKIATGNLANQLAQRYGVEILNSLREDMTVGELYALIKRG